MKISPTPYLAGVLGLTIVASSFELGSDLLAGAAFSVSSCVVWDLVFLKFKKIRLFFPWAAVVTGLILALVLLPETLVGTRLLAAALAIFSKNFLRIKRKHLFNPAAWGLWLISFFPGNVAWWIDGSPLALKLFLFAAVLSLLGPLKKIGLSLLFLVLAALGRFWLGLPVWPPVFIFFPLIMLPEPRTSPSAMAQQIPYLLIVFLSANLLARLPVNSGEPFLAALLLGNLWTRFYADRR